MRIAVSRAPGAERVVTPLEVFFDLVYVFAIGQLAHHLLEHIDLRTGAETVILALAKPRSSSAAIVLPHIGSASAARAGDASKYWVSRGAR